MEINIVVLMISFNVNPTRRKVTSVNKEVDPDSLFLDSEDGTWLQLKKKRRGTG
jgi:hypothetical protein